MHMRIKRRYPNLNKGVVSFLSVLVVLIAVVIPVVLLSYLILGEALSIYGMFNDPNSAAFGESVASVENAIRQIVPGFTVNMEGLFQQTARFIVDHLVSLFAGTA